MGKSYKIKQADQRKKLTGASEIKMEYENSRQISDSARLILIMETSLICNLLSTSHDVFCDKRMIWSFGLY